MLGHHEPLRGELSLLKRVYTISQKYTLSIINICKFLYDYESSPHVPVSEKPNHTGVAIRLMSKYIKFALRLAIVPTIDACLEFTAGDIGSPPAGASIWASIMRATPSTSVLGTYGLSVRNSARASLINPINAFSFAYRPAPTVWSPLRFSREYLARTCHRANWDSAVLRTPCSLLVAWYRPLALGLGMHTCWRSAHRPAPAWGNWLVLFLLPKCAPSASHSNPRLGDVADHTPAPSNRTCAVWPPLIRDGGGLQRTVSQRRELLALHEQGGRAVALNPWGKWYGDDARTLNLKFIENSIGGSIADSTRKNYKGHFEQWPTFRRINGLTPISKRGPSGNA